MRGSSKGGWRLAAGLLGLALLAGGGGPAEARDRAWDRPAAPSEGPAQAIGRYAGGCLAGGVALPPEGPGYQVIRLSRNRFFGHPETILYLQDLGRRLEQAGLGVALVGDITQPRGGPMPFGHASHQSGLDADIWLRLDQPRLSREDRETVTARLMVNRDAWQIDRAAWGPDQAEMLRLAAEDERVSRIFVHPVIKRELCQQDWPDRSWLRVVRPWFGHDAHFHVRLHCPEGSVGCEAQEPPPPGDGCGAELASWFPDPNRPPAPPTPPAADRPPPPPLPVACSAVFEGRAVAN